MLLFGWLVVVGVERVREQGKERAGGALESASGSLGFGLKI